MTGETDQPYLRIERRFDYLDKPGDISHSEAGWQEGFDLTAASWSESG
jgi:hypothetical protein